MKQFDLPDFILTYRHYDYDFDMIAINIQIIDYYLEKDRDFIAYVNHSTNSIHVPSFTYSTFPISCSLLNQELKQYKSQFSDFIKNVKQKAFFECGV